MICLLYTSLGDTVTPLVILAVSVCLNMAGDIFFVVVLKAGVAGAAIATVLAPVSYTHLIKFIVVNQIFIEGFHKPVTRPWII